MTPVLVEGLVKLTHVLLIELVGAHVEPQLPVELAVRASRQPVLLARLDVQPELGREPQHAQPQLPVGRHDVRVVTQLPPQLECLGRVVVGVPVAQGSIAPFLGRLLIDLLQHHSAADAIDRAGGPGLGLEDSAQPDFWVRLEVALRRSWGLEVLDLSHPTPLPRRRFQSLPTGRV
eukprot:scaffold80872_cov48-Phaeocystis_antarctica.AAC.3